MKFCFFKVDANASDPGQEALNVSRRNVERLPRRRLDRDT
jgi:hypothetical protein